MPKPITDWGPDEIREGFKGLPNNSLVARMGGRLMVASVADVSVDYDSRYPRSTYGYLSGPYVTDVTLTARLAPTGEMRNSLVTVLDGEKEANLSIVKNADEHSAKEVKKALKWLLDNGHEVRCVN